MEMGVLAKLWVGHYFVGRCNGQFFHRSSVIQGTDGTEISIVNVAVCRHLLKSVYQNINFLIS